ncbi:secreted RxLR effector protein 161-like [Ricinus communis]|uniref:secreted RxLR effector protein 161-like n=1 Tax=Ricinus communis TaxID=3988 RepID=UPI00201A2C08|nr:secreted RxLR effector protein 161-like [Ricinus communis]
MDGCKVAKTLISITTKLDKDEKAKSVNEKLYRGMIVSLLYLIAFKPDIMHSVCLCATFQSCPKESNLNVVKRILKYLYGTLNLRLWYPRETPFDIIGSSDADYASSLLDRKRTSKTYHFLGKCLVPWFSKKQVSVALSTTEAKDVAADCCCAQILWMRQQLRDYGREVDHIPTECDNISAIYISKNPIQHSRSKHIDIRHLFLRDHVQNGSVVLEYLIHPNN